MAPLWRQRSIFSSLILLCTISLITAEPNSLPGVAPQAPFFYEGRPSTEDATVKQHRVAIIGAGAAGSSTAYHLRQLSDGNSQHVDINITVFETHSRVGGRTTTVDVLEDPRYPTELGASIFSAKYNTILANAVLDFNLTTLGADMGRLSHDDPYQFGVWDGTEFVFKSSSSDGREGLGGRSWAWWWDTIKLLWRYGLAPLQTQRLMQDTVAKFLQLYQDPFFPFTNLTKAAAQTGLLELTSQTGQQLMSGKGIGERFAREVVQASTRVNYGQNLGLIHGLETMVCMAAEEALAVEGGNWRIFDSMVKSSGAEIRLNTSVQKVDRLPGGEYRIRSRKLKESVGNGGAVQSEEDEEDTFDTVILAAPYQFSRIKFRPSLPDSRAPHPIPYVTVHVTLITTPHRPSPKFFNPHGSSELESEYGSIPSTILTTLPPNEDLSPDERNLSSAMHGVGPTGFWSISTLGRVQADNFAAKRLRQGQEQEQGKEEQEKHYLYKIFSPKPLSVTFVRDLFDIPRGEFPSYPFHSDPRDNIHGYFPYIPNQHISSLLTKKWTYAYPYAFPRPPLTGGQSPLQQRQRGEAAKPVFPEMNLDGAGLWYTSGMETLISTMETSALMGKNVAAVVVNQLRDEGRQGEKSKKRWRVDA